MDGLDEKLRQSLASFEKVYVGFSGGLDSCALLHKLSQEFSLHSKLIAVHVNHGLSPYAEEWAAFAEKTAHSLNVSFKKFSVSFNKNGNIEEAARDARYHVFTALLNENDVLVLAHHQNDQAETLLLHLFRGAGIDGLASMPEWRNLGKGKLYRPLLHYSRQTLENYATANHLLWIDDESNQNVHFNRNFLRHQILPELQKRWPGLIHNLCRSAQHCASAKQFIHIEIEKVLKDMVDEKYRLSITKLLAYPRETQCFLLREWLTQQHFKKPSQDKILRILNELILAKEDACPIISWKEGTVRRYQNKLYALSPQGIFFDTEIIEKEMLMLKKESPDALFEVRYRQGGEKIRWKGQTRELKKLFQEWQVPPWERQHVPLIYKDNVLIKVLLN